MSDLRRDLIEAAGRTPRSADIDRIRRRGTQLKRRRTLTAAAAITSVLTVVAVVVGTQLGAGRDGATVVTDDPPPASAPAAPDASDGDLPPAPTSAPPSSVPSEPDPPSSVAPSAEPLAPDEAPASGEDLAGPSRQRILDDPAGDTTQGPTVEPDPSLDLVALDVAYDGEAVTFIHVVDGAPSSNPPPGGTGRWHDTYFRIPGHNLVHVRAETMERDLIVVVGVIVPGARVGTHPAQRCVACDLTFDADAHEIRIRIPVDFLNDVLSRSDGGEIRSGVRVGGWEAHTAKTHTTRTSYEERESPHYFSETRMDSAKRYDVFWTVP